MSAKLDEVIARATRDPFYADELRSKAVKAARSGHGSADFDDLLREFATSPADLARMKARSEDPDSATHTTTTTSTTTTTTWTTVPCTSTTITTTTSIFDTPDPVEE